MSKPPASLDLLRQGLTMPDAVARLVEARPGRGGRQAAVLILLWQDAAAAPGERGAAAGLRLVFIEKTAHLRKHAGQIAFPGGAVEERDVSPVAAALREAHEEVGVTPATVRVLGTLPAAHIAASGFDAASVVGWWSTPGELWPHDLVEVAAVHQVPVPRLVDPAGRWTALHPSGYAGPAFWVDDLFIWGFTAHLLDGLLDLAGWEQPWDRGRRTEIPGRFLRGRR